VPSVLSNVWENIQEKCPSSVVQIFAPFLLKLAGLSKCDDQIFQALAMPTKEIINKLTYFIELLLLLVTHNVAVTQLKRQEKGNSSNTNAVLLRWHKLSPLNLYKFY